MSRRSARVELTRLLGGDAELVDMLEDAGILPDGEFTADQVEDALVAHTLIRELEVNIQGVEVILRLRQELIETRRQVRRLVEFLLAESDGNEPGDED